MPAGNIERLDLAFVLMVLPRRERPEIEAAIAHHAVKGDATARRAANCYLRARG